MNGNTIAVIVISIVFFLLGGFFGILFSSNQDCPEPEEVSETEEAVTVSIIEGIPESIDYWYVTWDGRYREKEFTVFYKLKVSDDIEIEIEMSDTDLPKLLEESLVTLKEVIDESRE